MPASAEPRRVLILGGTGDAARLARALAGRGGIEATVSLAGLTRVPAPLPLPVRRGGFGGAGGLAEHLRAGGVTHLIDATHPFAARISASAVEAAAALDLPLLRLARPPWMPGPDERWIEVADPAAAARALPAAARQVFLAIGRRDLASFAIRPDIRFHVRMIEPPEAALPLTDHRVILARGPFEFDAETALFRGLRIDSLVAKNAGGTGARAKLTAAAALCLPVVMIRRPILPPAREVESVEDALVWLARGSPTGQAGRAGAIPGAPTSNG